MFGERSEGAMRGREENQTYGSCVAGEGRWHWLPVI